MEQFIEFLAKLEDGGEGEEGNGRLPSLQRLGQMLGQSVPQVREQVAVARALGLVEARPRVGLRRLPYSFAPAASLSLHYAVHRDRRFFEQFSDLRKHLEMAYFHEAAATLQPEDLEALQRLVASAWEKLRGEPIQIPHQEHRALHITIFRRLENVFVVGLLEAYWDAYEAVGLNLYTDYAYLETVWQYHQRIVEALVAGDVEAAYRALVEHTDLLYHREGDVRRQDDVRS